MVGVTVLVGVIVLVGVLVAVFVGVGVGVGQGKPPISDVQSAQAGTNGLPGNELIPFQVKVAGPEVAVSTL